MNKIFLDTDVIMDFLLKREPFAKTAAQLFEMAEMSVITIHTSSVCFGNIYYIARKWLGHENVLLFLKRLTLLAIVLPVDNFVISQALDSNFKDFEDAIQHFTALHANHIEAILTRNTKDYQQSQLPVFTPDEFLAMLLQNPK